MPEPRNTAASKIGSDSIRFYDNSISSRLVKVGDFVARSSVCFFVPVFVYVFLVLFCLFFCLFLVLCDNSMQS